LHGVIEALKVFEEFFSVGVFFGIGIGGDHMGFLDAEEETLLLIKE